MTVGTVHAERVGAVGRLTFDNPARLNAVSHRMWLAAGDALEEFAGDDSLRVIVLTGAGGKAFSAGDDISDFAENRNSAEAEAADKLASERAMTLLRGMPQPTIAAIRGYCIGGGLETAITCDLRIAADGARFAIPAARLGLGYNAPGIAMLCDLVGPSFAKEIFFTARQFSAGEAHDMGLIDRIVPDALLDAMVADYTKIICENDSLDIGAVKSRIAATASIAP